MKYRKNHPTIIHSALFFHSEALYGHYRVFITQILQIYLQNVIFFQKSLAVRYLLPTFAPDNSFNNSKFKTLLPIDEKFTS
jgi:hypothetical protein